MGKVRKPVHIKSYMCVFVSFSVRAVHLELVPDQISEAFLAALRRFVARRGRSQRIHSDHGTNFIGAKHQLKSLAQALASKSISSDITDYCASMGIEWSFIPERAPNFGGLWESTVKSVKKHLSAKTNRKCFIFEEMSTLLAQIEAVLNSRPLMPISSDDTDLSILTPGHFLIGQPITALLDQDYSNMKILTRWNLVQKTIQDFWRRWSNEYLTSLNHHQKWRKPHRNVQIGDLLLIKDEKIFHCQCQCQQCLPMLLQKELVVFYVYTEME